MSNNGIMEEIRGLLSEGRSAPEIIGKGFAPSTVYTVQRDTRRKSGAYGISRYGNRASGCGLEHWGQVEAENQRLNVRLDSLERQLAAVAEEATASPLWDRVDELQRTMEEIATCQEQITRELRAEKAIIGKIDAELDALAQVYKDERWFGNAKWQRRSG